MLDKETALLNEVPAGALVREVVPGSSAAEAGLEPVDILVEAERHRLVEVEGGLAGWGYY